MFSFICKIYKILGVVCVDVFLACRIACQQSVASVCLTEDVQILQAVRIAVLAAARIVCKADSGVGIPEDEKDKIFERFYRVDKARSRETGGTGLGLAITKSVIVLHHGAIRVDSKPGEGTVFTVRVPLKYQA